MLAAALLSALAFGGCQPSGDDAKGSGEGQGDRRKSPFATGNVSVAPQVEGRPAAPTPVPAPRPSVNP